MNEKLNGFRMPAEWENQKSVWIAWPYNCLLYTSPSPRDS